MTRNNLIELFEKTVFSETDAKYFTDINNDFLSYLAMCNGIRIGHLRLYANTCIAEAYKNLEALDENSTYGVKYMIELKPSLEIDKFVFEIDNATFIRLAKMLKARKIMEYKKNSSQEEEFNKTFEDIADKLNLESYPKKRKLLIEKIYV